MADGQVVASDYDVVSQLRQALDSRVVIEQAKGMIAVQRGLPVAAAFDQLRAEARRRRLSIHLVAAEVVRAHDGSATTDGH
jgi:AmiR/NasT family two-component response regulator